MSTTPKKLLFLTSSDYGQANVVLATTYALLASGAPVELHVGSEYALESEIKQAVKLADETLGPSTTPNKIHFHGIKGDSQFTAMSRPVTGILDTWQLPAPNFANCADFLRKFSVVRDSHPPKKNFYTSFPVFTGFEGHIRAPGILLTTSPRNRQQCHGNRRWLSTFTSTTKLSISSKK